MSYRISQFKPKYKASLLKLLGCMWKGLSHEQIKEKFEWRYELNPFQQEPCILLAIDESDAVVGFRAFVVQEFCYQNEKIKIYNPADAIIHPGYRRKGLYSKMTDRLINTVSEKKNEAGIVLNLSSNEKSTPGNLKLGWRCTNGRKEYGYKNSIGNLLFVRNRREIKEFEEQTKYGIFKIVKNIKTDILEPNSFNHLKSSAVIQNCRSEAYYKWRYVQAPDKEDYFFTYLMDENKLSAYAIFKFHSIKQYRLMEYGAESCSLLKFLIKKVIDDVQIPTLVTWMINQRDQEVLSQIGFNSRNKWILKLLKKERLPVLVRPAVASPTDEDFLLKGKHILDINNWNLCLADSH